MTSDSEWEDNSEDGTTLGPEEALKREIEKSKALKVEKLALKDQLEVVLAEIEILRQENTGLKSVLKEFESDSLEMDSSSSKGASSASVNLDVVLMIRFFFALFVILVLSLLAFFLIF